MTDAQRAAICLTGRLLAYPDAAFLAALPGIAAEAEAIGQGGEPEFAAAAHEFITAMRNLDPDDAAQVYVAVFDHASACSLYMAWHRYGNDRGQGRALAALNGLYRTAGFEPEQGCMPDYLPRMLEFLAIAPDWAAEALLDGFGPEMAAIASNLADADVPWGALLLAGLAPLRAQHADKFSPRTEPDATIRPMARPVPEPAEPLIPFEQAPICPQTGAGVNHE